MTRNVRYTYVKMKVNEDHVKITTNLTQNDSYQICKSYSFGQNVQITHQNSSNTLRTNIKEKTVVLKSILKK